MEDKNLQDQAASSSVEQQSTVQPQAAEEQAGGPSTADRAELVARARAFLHSPQVAQHDASAKRRFLMEKGLNNAEIEELLRESVRSDPLSYRSPDRITPLHQPVQRPPIPPPTYPQPPPSNLPTLLLGLTRLFSWLLGGSAALVFFYHRFLLPRIIQTSAARHSLRGHHLALMKRLHSSLTTLKKSQTESYSVLPRPQPYKEDEKFAMCRSVAQVVDIAGGDASSIRTVNPVTMLRCGIEELRQKADEGVDSEPTTEELFRHFESCIPWLLSEDGLTYERKLWDSLTTCPLFIATPPLSTESGPTSNLEPTRWNYNPPTPLEPSPLMRYLINLSSSFPERRAEQSAYQHTLQALSEFTGYLSAQVYLAFRGSGNSMTFGGINNTLSPAEEEFKREVRTMKGLVLNRRSFMTPQVTSPP